jgi:SAM-dependent methyltransferase
MAAWLAGRVTGIGSVLATDLDVSGLTGLHSANITVTRHDLEREEVPAGGFDLIHARLVLEHLRGPAAAVSRLTSALRGGGWLLLEDADGLLFDAEPAAISCGAGIERHSIHAGNAQTGQGHGRPRHWGTRRTTSGPARTPVTDRALRG